MDILITSIFSKNLIQKLLNTQTKSVSFASIILMASYLAAALLGLLRDRLLAGKFGAGNELDVYYTAFVVPDFIALILIFGAVSSAIIPIFSSYYVKSKDDAFEYVSSLLKMFLLVLIAVSAALIIFAPFLVSLIAPGFSAVKKADTVLLMQIMFLSPIILGISNTMSGLLQFFHRFLVTALAPLMYNIGIICGILFFVPIFGLMGLAFGVIFGGLLHLIIQLPAFFYSGFRYKARIPGQKIFSFGHKGVVKTLKLMAPRSIGLGAGQINTIVITAIASTLATGSVAVFNLAGNLSSMAISAVAVSLSTAIFPSMSLAFSRDDSKDFEKKFSGAFKQILFLLIPLSILIFILRAQIVRVILGVGKFSWLDTRLTAACLVIFAVGILAQALIVVLFKTFYAAHNTKIPAIISVLTVIFNVAMSFLFVWLLSFQGAFYSLVNYLLKLNGLDDIRIVGLTLAFSVTAIAEAILLLVFLYKKFDHFDVKIVVKSLYKILVASFAMAIVTFFVRQSLVNLEIVKLETFRGIFFQLTLTGLAGGITYLFASWSLKSQELKLIRSSFFKEKRTT